VEGEVTKVDTRNTRVEISIGSDDGLTEGNELDVYHLNPPEYLGRIRVETLSNDHSVGKVIQTNKGLKIKEGDIVATKIRARS